MAALRGCSSPKERDEPICPRPSVRRNESEDFWRAESRVNDMLCLFLPPLVETLCAVILILIVRWELTPHALAYNLASLR